MSGRVAVVTGAASGIGLGVARRLAADGHAVALLDQDGAAAEQAAAELVRSRSRAAGYEVDVADRGATRAGVRLGARGARPDHHRGDQRRHRGVRRRSWRSPPRSGTA